MNYGWKEGRGREVPGNYFAVLALHWINFLFRKYVYPGMILE